MDRNKSGPSRSSKGKMTLPHHGSELYALGSKSSSNRDDSKSKGLPTSKVPDRKRENPNPIPSVSSKKTKLSTIIGTTRPSETYSSTTSNVVDYWEQIAVETDPTELVTSVMTAIEHQDSESVIALVCGGIKSVISARGKSDSIMTLSLFYLAKLRPNLFHNETITAALISVLKRDSQHAFKGRNNPTLHILAANLLARGYHDQKQWPESFLRMYIDDAINERVWVDYEDCATFIDNICYAFGTRIPPKSMLQPELSALTPTAKDSSTIDDESTSESAFFGGGEGSNRVGDGFAESIGQSRFGHISHTVEKLVLDAIKDILNRRQNPDCSTRNLLRFLSASCGICEVRALAISRLELWIHNAKLVKPAQELLTYICYNVTSQMVRDHEVLMNLVKMRLKTKPLINIYMSCLKEMITLQPLLLLTVLKMVVQNELSNARNPNNMGMLANIFQVKPEAAARCLAEIYQDFLLQRDDCLRTLRVFLRELVKMLRYDINLAIFCKTITTNREEMALQINACEFRDRIFASTVDIVCISMFLSVSPQIREANISLKTGREFKDATVLHHFYTQMSKIQCDALLWMHEIVPGLYKPSAMDYSQSLHKLLFLDAPEQYSKGDQWPPEPERGLLMRLVSETPVDQNSILRIIMIGVTKEIPFSIPDTMEMVEQVVRRAAGLRTAPGYPPLNVSKLEIIDFLFNMAEYHHPDNIVLPVGYAPPKLAISTLYWKAWNTLLMLSAHNTTTFGAFCWTRYPMLRALMEMCITNHFIESKTPADELQLATLERTQILEFETHLAAATSKVVINEQNSLLLSQLMLMDPVSCARRPPIAVLEHLQSLNATHRLGHLLCRSRKPDLLLDIIQRQGTSQSMPWLADLVQNSDGDFNHLPVQCLCEFLLSNSSSLNTDNKRDVELLAYLQNLLRDDDAADHQASSEVLEYFLRRLSSTTRTGRQSAIRGMKLLLNIYQQPDDEQAAESDWLLVHLPQIPHFNLVRAIVIGQLRAACQIENSPELIMTYIQFIAAHTLQDPVPEMLEHVFDMSQLIVERNTIFSCIVPNSDTDIEATKLQTLNCLFVMFNNYLVKLREQNGKTIVWPDYPDLMMVHFTDGTQLPIYLSIVQAHVILLTQSPLIASASAIMHFWFPLDSPPPRTFTIDTAEPVQILPDWLKLKMIRSDVDRLVDVALQDLTPDQIVLFVQNFGTPIASMSKLLALLDRAVIEQFDTVKAAIMNSAYLTQLIEIQQTRGAKNGHIAMQALAAIKSSEDAETETDSTISRLEPLVIDLNGDTPSPATLNEIEDCVLASSMVPTGIVKNLLSDTARITAQKMLERLLVSQQLVNSSSVCTLFRLVFDSNTDIRVLDQCISELNITKHSTLRRLVMAKRKAFCLPKSKDSAGDKSLDLISVLRTSELTNLEGRVSRLLSALLRQTNTGYVVTVLTSVLSLGNLTGPQSVGYDNDSAKTGLLVDWLANVDSELISAAQNSQQDLLFNGTGGREFRFYMLSLLSHQSSWTTLRSAVDMLLSQFNVQYDATSVLDFLGAIIRNPKMWQGRDKAISKHEHMDIVLHLNEPQARTFVDYILAESNRNTSATDFLSQRVHLLLQCIEPNNSRIHHRLVVYVENRPFDEMAKRKFMQQLYINIPPLKIMPNRMMVDVRHLSGCEADKVCNYTVTATTALSSAKDWQSMSTELELLLRKLAATHPLLLLRHLSVLASLLQGRGHMDMQVLRAEYHLPLFMQIIGILELLQPIIFDEAYADSLHAALDCYFALHRYHPYSKDMYGILCKFMDFLQAYTTASAARALHFIEPHSQLLQNLAIHNTGIMSLQQLVQGVTLLKHKSTNVILEVREDDDENSGSGGGGGGGSEEKIEETKPIKTEVDSRSAAAAIIAPFARTIFIPPHWQALLNSVHRADTNDDILGALQEIESVTVKRSALIEDLFDKVLELVLSPSAGVRTIAHILLTRHLKHNPGNATTNLSALTAYIQCLTQSDSNVALSALDTLTESVICLQEYAADILRTVFELGVSSKINTYVHICKCILALKMQHAC